MCEEGIHVEGGCFGRRGEFGVFVIQKGVRAIRLVQEVVGSVSHDLLGCALGIQFLGEDECGVGSVLQLPRLRSDARISSRVGEGHPLAGGALRAEGELVGRRVEGSQKQGIALHSHRLQPSSLTPSWTHPNGASSSSISWRAYIAHGPS